VPTWNWEAIDEADRGAITARKGGEGRGRAGDEDGEGGIVVFATVEADDVVLGDLIDYYELGKVVLRGVVDERV